MATLSLNESADEAGLAGVWVANHNQIDFHFISGFLLLHQNIIIFKTYVERAKTTIKYG
jgi:hypothetical protein